MPSFVASKFFSQHKFKVEDRFSQNACTVEELPLSVSALRSGENIMIRHTGAATETGEEGFEAYGHLVLWTTYAAVDQTWGLVRQEFLQDQLGRAVAIAARKQKPDWDIEEARRPFGDCRLTVCIPHSSSITYQTQAARQIADLLSGVNISNIFYVANTDIAQTKSVPTAARLTQPVYESASHHLVYVQPAANEGSTNASASTWHNPVSNRGALSEGQSGNKSGPDSDKWQRSGGTPAGQAPQRQAASTGQHTAYRKPGPHSTGRGADSEKW